MNTRPCRTRGFTLLETLLALAIGSMAVLGTATLLLRALALHNEALQHAAAAEQLADFAEQLRANAAASAAYTTAQYPAGSTLQSCILTRSCSADELAQHQLAAWQQELAATLAGTRAGPASGETVYGPALGGARTLQLSLQWGEAAQSASAHLQLLAAVPREAAP